MISITMMSHLRWLPPLWCLTAPPSPRGIGRATKGKRLYGQASRLTSPDLHILCRMCTVDNKAPQSNPFTQRIAKNKVPPPGGKVVAPAIKRGAFPSPAGRLYGFIQTGAFYNLEAPTTTLAPKGETTHYDLCVALLLQIMFAVHARGASNLSLLRTFGPAGRQPSSPSGLIHKTPKSGAFAPLNLYFLMPSSLCRRPV